MPDSSPDRITTRQTALIISLITAAALGAFEAGRVSARVTSVEDRQDKLEAIQSDLAEITKELRDLSVSNKVRIDHLGREARHEQ